ncbi:SH3 domain-containing protein [Taibaiella koreensis]|uniref:SH3 domain-containing protein n=1 Tax=Taibaiella koreensis TaxID=1268548 RepID=UPI000E59959D|nr:tetratricopeptide repeat protein [Taibaiella koreensis]
MQVNWCKRTAGNMLLLFVWLLSLAGPARADIKTDNALWQKGNALYTQKQYDSAAACYEALLQRYPRDARLHYNAANAYYRLNKVGVAILHYEKATFLDPGNQQVKDNLLLAKGRVQNPLPEASPIFFVAWWKGLLKAFGSNVWAVLSLLAFAAILVLVYLTRVRKERFTHSGRWLSLAIVSLLICGCMTWFTYDAATNSHRAVVLQAGANLLDAPRTNGKTLGSLPEGTLLEVSQEEGQFMNVKLPNGREGWVAATVAGKV